MSRVPVLLVLLLAAGPAFAQADRLPPDLALVPQDGLGFVHVRVADLWGHESLKDARDIVKKAGDKAIAALDGRFGSLPTSVDRLTLWVGRTRSKHKLESDLVFVVRLSRPADVAALRKLLAPEAAEKKGKKLTWYADEFGASLLIADDRTFAMGPKAEIARLADGAPFKSDPLRDSLSVAAGGRPLVVGMNPAALPAAWWEDFSKEIPLPMRLLLSAGTVTASLDLDGEGHMHVRLSYATAAAAEAVEPLLKAPDGPARKLIASSRRDLEELVLGSETPVGLEQVPIAAAAVIGLGVLNRAEEVITSNQVRRDGSAIEARLELPAKSKTVVVPAAFTAGAFIGGWATQWREEIRNRQTYSLKQLMLGVHNYHDTNGKADAAITDADGKPLLSWRVALLPYIEEDSLFKQIRQDEPWDSENNKKFIEKMPKIFEIDGETAKPGYTHYRTFVGPKASWAFDRSVKLADITDGTSNTVLLVQAAEPVIWTKPDELPFDGKQAVKPLLLFRDGRTVVGLADGSARIVRDTVTEAIWKLLIDPADGQPIPDGTFK
ncbi:MAG TPA: DUF1559 domain-containing protein [Gemmataceae bacterium]|nr:DUF1559 domain-containing protein [Gemmataceae bacterium]